MASEFVRKITNSKLRGQNSEPLNTNTQNDLLSDDEDVFVRNKDEYHALTDNIKTISIPPENDTIEVRRTGKNSVRLIGKKMEFSINNPDGEPLLQAEEISDNEWELTIIRDDTKAEKEDFDDLQLWVSAIHDRVTWTEDELDNERLEMIEQRLDELEDLTDLNNRLQNIENRLDELEEPEGNEVNE